jgi:hypothetical protein
MADYLEALGHVFQDLRDVLADPAHRDATVRAITGRFVHALFVRQMLGQCPSSGLRLLLRRNDRGTCRLVGDLQLLSSGIQ